MNNLISIAKIINFHGIKGEVRVGYTSGKERQLKSCKLMYVKSPDGKESTLTVDSVRFHKNYAIIKFSEINSVDDTQRYKGTNLYITKDDVKKFLEQDEYLISDLKDLDVYDTHGDLIGKVITVGENSANDLITIKDKEGKSHLVPFVKELVPTVDIAKNKIVINNIEGLMN